MNFSLFALQKKISFSGRFGPEKLNVFRAVPGRAEIYKTGTGRAGPGRAARSRPVCSSNTNKEQGKLSWPLTSNPVQMRVLPSRIYNENDDIHV